jgi:hypothetical protein
MKSLTVKADPSLMPVNQAREVAIKEGLNCYSQADGGQRDFVTDQEAVFYFAWHGKTLEVIIQLTSADPFGEPVEVPAMEAASLF